MGLVLTLPFEMGEEIIALPHISISIPKHIKMYNKFSEGSIVLWNELTRMNEHGQSPSYESQSYLLVAPKDYGDAYCDQR